VKERGVLLRAAKAGSKGNCLAHATQAHQRDAINNKRKRKRGVLLRAAMSYQ
jgi:hypothetical protein